MKKLSEQIRTMRKSKQLTQAQMAEILGVQYQSISVICADAMDLSNDTQYDIVTIIGSTAKESDSPIALFQKACTLVKPGGSLYYQILDENEDGNQIIKTTFANNMQLSSFFEDFAYGFRCHYYKFCIKQKTECSES